MKLHNVGKSSVHAKKSERPSGTLACGSPKLVGSRILDVSRTGLMLAGLMLRFVLLLVNAGRSAFRSRADLKIENLALRQQLAVLACRGWRRQITAVDRLFWVALRKLWSRWAAVVVFVKPETVIEWHRAGFRRYWTWLSRRHRAGRPSINASLRALILRMATENPTWGATRIHGELRMLGFEVSERTVSGYLPRERPTPGAVERWITFLRNHRDAIAAMDFFTIPTATFRILYVWVCHRSREETRPAFRRDRSPRSCVGRPAASRGISSRLARATSNLRPRRDLQATGSSQLSTRWVCMRRGRPTGVRGRTASQNVG
jgi:hypothetical protein